ATGAHRACNWPGHPSTGYEPQNPRRAGARSTGRGVGRRPPPDAPFRARCAWLAGCSFPDHQSWWQLPSAECARASSVADLHLARGVPAFQLLQQRIRQTNTPLRAQLHHALIIRTQQLYLDRHSALLLGTMWRQQSLQTLRVSIVVQGDAQATGTGFTGQLQVKNSISIDTQAAGVIVVADLALDDDQLVFFQALAMLFKQLIEDGHFQLRRAVIQHGVKHLAATCHAYTHR